MKYPNGHQVACFNELVIYSLNLSTVVGVEHIVFEKLAVGHVADGDSGPRDYCGFSACFYCDC